jgi:hypothetical protein
MLILWLPTPATSRCSALPVPTNDQQYYGLGWLLSSQPNFPVGVALRRDDWPPQIRALTVPAPLPHLLPPALDCIGLYEMLPTRPTDEASDAVRVPPVAALPPASSRPRLAVTPLR